jgi:hypothetical protein
MAEVVVEVPKGTSGGSPGVQDVFVVTVLAVVENGRAFKLFGSKSSCDNG